MGALVGFIATDDELMREEKKYLRPHFFPGKLIQFFEHHFFRILPLKPNCAFFLKSWVLMFLRGLVFCLKPERSLNLDLLQAPGENFQHMI